MWPKDAPGDINGEIGPEELMKPKEPAKDVLRIKNVSDPTFTLFPATSKKSDGVAVIVCPGGGYNILAYEHEGTQVCEWLNQLGVTAILLKYRVPRRKNRPPYEAPLQDAQRALGMIRQNAKKWDLNPLISAEPHRKYFLIYYQDNKPIAFTFMRDVGLNSVFSTQFAWNYENPKLYLGKYANLAEIDYCIEHNKDYMYLGFGYEKSCIYKADYEGFEFWTGEEWSDDTEHYKWLCERDSKIIKTSDLDKIKRYDDEHFFK